MYEEESLEKVDDISVIDKMLKEQWNFEICGTHSIKGYGLSVDDKRCLEILNKTR